jgi:hypothetical protein
LILGESGNNAALAARTYAARYPGRRHPSVNAIRRVDDRLRQNLAIVPTQKGVVPGRSRTRRTPALEEAIIAAVEANPRTSVRQIARELVVPFKIVNRVIKDEHLHSYHYTKVQAVLPQDYEPRMQHAHWLLERNDNFLEKVLWTDEALFTRDGVFNRHNEFSYPTSTRRHGNFAGVHTLLRIILSSNSAVLINIITGVSPPHFDFFVFYVLCQC